MKTLSASLKALVVASLACAAGFASAATQDLTVEAKVVGTCKFSDPSTMGFGTLSQTSTSDTTKTANVKYKCTTNTTSAGITIATGPLAMKNADGDSLPFTLVVTSGDKSKGLGLATGTATDLTAVLTGTIVAADVQAAVAGDYTTTVELTITP